MGYRPKFKEPFTLTAIYVGQDTRVRFKMPVQPTKIVVPALLKELVAAGHLTWEDVLPVFQKRK